MFREIGLIGATGIAERAIIGPARARDDVRVYAVAASSAERARGYRDKHGIPVAHDDYRALVDDPRVAVVYVSLHNSAHCRWAVAAARAGKHVLVEKPLCLSRRELHALRRAAADGGVRLLEAVMTAHHPWQAVVRGMIASRELGELLSVTTHITFDIPPGAGYRFRPELGGGALFDTAAYWLQAVQATVGLGGATAEGHSDFSGPHGVDVAFTAHLSWPSGVRATLHAGLAGPYRADHEFTFSGGVVRLRNFLRPSAGALPVNLIVLPHDGPRRVESFRPLGYFAAQLDRVLSTLDQPGTDEVARSAERVALMEDAYLDALGRAAVG
ncbi:Gfo/Idh/MocA family protein [Goodfellowiella coeruleoviolacea]|uniref:Dehydrogenase n=1 Tax=Goodfellowiella coeruleoviolacea TaxID=334858 RepID=A0AAE3G9F7_9PSEU|nr:Gfo/Idh/MocA family oxidoreductase [Goodfellowiella coeruleoviolacea]MCP2163167.1 putative dehydrogenase [Goodfellowiella coeruleoviolacea]